jgi:hypothetical protein
MQITHQNKYSIFLFRNVKGNICFVRKSLFSLLSMIRHEKNKIKKQK